jgi:hypothetical protein
MDVEREIMNTVGELGLMGYDLSCIFNGSLGSPVVSLPGSPIVTTSIDGDLDSDGTTANFLALEGVDGLLLFFLVTNVDKAVSLAPSGPTPPYSNDASGNDVETRIGEESSETIIVDVKAEVGDKENGLGGFADRILADGTRGTMMEPGPAMPRPGRIFCRRISRGSVSIGSRSGRLSFGGLEFAAVPVLVLFPLGLLRFFGGRSSFSPFGRLTIHLGVVAFFRSRPGRSSALVPPLEPPWPIPLLFWWSGDFDDDQTTIEICLVQSLDDVLGGLDGGKSDETVTSRANAVARLALDDLSADDVTLSCLEEGLQPFIRGGIRKISSKDLETGGHGWGI